MTPFAVMVCCDGVCCDGVCCGLCSADALEKNQQLEFERNKERFAFLKVSTGALSLSSCMLGKKKKKKRLVFWVAKIGRRNICVSDTLND